MIRRLRIPVILSVIMLYSIVFLSVSVSADTATIQPSNQDTFINGAFPGLNYGGGAELIVRAASATESYRVLVQFDLSSIPSGATVTSATLKLYYYEWGTADPVGRTIWGYRLTQSWTEMGASWLQYDGTNSWSSSGGDYTLDGGSSATVPSSYGWMTWTVTDIVKAWIEDSEPNCGFLIKDATETSTPWCATEFYSRDTTNPDHTELQPILEITYTEQVFPTIESCDSVGANKDIFQLSDEVYTTGTGYTASKTYDVYLVEDVMWADGMAIPPRVPGTATTVTSDASGNVPAILLWSDPLTPGKYDIIVDVNGDGLYYAESDALDDNDIEVTAGFFVIPEVAIGSIMVVAAMFAALGLFAYKKKYAPKQ